MAFFYVHFSIRKDYLKLKLYFTFNTIYISRDYKDHSNRNKDNGKPSLRKDDTTLSTPSLNNEFVNHFYSYLKNIKKTIIINLGKMNQ